MANPEHLAILKQGIKSWNQWRLLHPEIDPDLSACDCSGELLVMIDLHNVRLEHSDFSRAIIVNADLTNANIGRGRFHFTNVSDTRLQSANLINATFHKADLSGADFSAANLSGAVFHRTTLVQTNFNTAIFGGTVFSDVDLSPALNLDGAVHRGPSTIGVNTLYKSRAVIPEIFLQGGGVPDDLISHMKSLAPGAFKFYSCFISYSTHDQEFAGHLHADLQINGVRCWFAPHDVKGGRKLDEQIDEAIRAYDRLLLIFSEHSMSSEWVKTEIANARQREIREKWQMLFPISLIPYEKIREWKAFDADTGKDSAREIREYFIPDFSNLEKP